MKKQQNDKKVLIDKILCDETEYIICWKEAIGGFKGKISMLITNKGNVFLKHIAGHGHVQHYKLIKYESISDHIMKAFTEMSSITNPKFAVQEAFNNMNLQGGLSYSNNYHPIILSFMSNAT